MSTVIKDLGAVSAYAYAVEKGYTGTEAEFAELMADYAEVGQRAEDAAESALNSKTAAQTAATTATNKASEATTAAQAATTKAGEAQASAQTASNKALEASQSASQALTYKTGAESAKTASQTAQGLAESARDDAITAKTAAVTAQGKAEDAQAAAESVAESIPSDYSQLSEDVTDLKEDLNAIHAETDNLYDYSFATDGKVINSSGTVVDNSGYCISAHIPIPDSFKFVVRYCSYVSFFKSDNTHLGREACYQVNDDNKFAVYDFSSSSYKRNGAAYVILSIALGDKTRCLMVEGSTKKLYERSNIVYNPTAVNGLRGVLDKRDSINFGNIPNGYYYGQHIDTTGFNQDTSWADAIAAWDALLTQAKYYCTKTDLGTTFGTGHMYKYRFKPPAPSSSNKPMPKLLIVTGLHGHEKTGTYALLYLIQDMLNHATDSPELNYLRNHVIFEIIPCANWYGWNNNVRYNYNGVNLNRNYPALNWSDFDNDPTYTTPQAYNYRGATAFSEPETRYIRDWVLGNPDALALIDIHTNGTDTQHYWDISDVLYPYFFHDDYDGQLAEVGDSFVAGLRSHLDTLYGVNGTLDYSYGSAYAEEQKPELINWIADEGKMIGLLHEGTPGSSNGFLGSTLTQYAPEVIKLNAEMIGNLILQLLAKFA